LIKKRKVTEISLYLSKLQMDCLQNLMEKYVT